jgi:hypothetical protein
MSSSKTTDSERRYGEVCGATNNRGEPCKLPAGWGTPGSGGGRCKFHGGLSTGAKDTSHLEENDFAEGNAGGGAPEGNTNSRIHGGFSDWRKAYERFDDDMKAYVEDLRDCMRETAKEHAPDVPEERRERLIKEKATLSVIKRRAGYDAWAFDREDARGFVIEGEKEIDGETYITPKPNPALTAESRIAGRQYVIARELRLWWGFQDDTDR